MVSGSIFTQDSKSFAIDDACVTVDGKYCQVVRDSESSIVLVREGKQFVFPDGQYRNYSEWGRPLMWCSESKPRRSCFRMNLTLSKCYLAIFAHPHPWCWLIMLCNMYTEIGIRLFGAHALVLFYASVQEPAFAVCCVIVFAFYMHFMLPGAIYN